MLHSRSRSATFVALVCLSGSLVAGAPGLLGSAGAVDPASIVAADNAVAWIITQQQPDGGFEVTGFQGFETPDAVLAIAEAAQTPGTPWNPAAALGAVTAIEYGGSGGPNPLDALDDWADSPVNAGEAGKLIVLVTEPLGIDPTDFDPSGDSASAVDLTEILDPLGCAGNPASYGFFNETIFGALAKFELCGAPNPAAMATIRDGQRADGGWNYLGDPSDITDSDLDTTALAVQALVAGGATFADPAISAALKFIASKQTPTGGFDAFGSPDPNATASAVVAITAAGFDATVSCWRDSADPAATGTAYADPSAWLRSQQQPDGHIASPNDIYPPVNTFATSQSVQALLLSWWPVARAAGSPTCAVVPVPPVPPVPIQPLFTG